MKYGFDLDDTLCDTASVINEYAIKYDIEVLNGNGLLNESNDSKDYYYFINGLNWSREDIKNFFDKYYLEIISKVKIKSYVKDTINRLKKENNKVYVITARRQRENNIVERITSRWLLDNGITIDGLFINVTQKSDLVKELNIDVFVDDSYDTCLEVKNKTKAKVYIMKTKYNEGIIDNSLSSIESIQELIKDN